MTTIEESIRNRSRQLLESGEVAEVIAWGNGRFKNQTTPLFITDPDRASEIVCNSYCANTLSKYALSEKALGKIAICVRGCDSRAINRLIADKQIAREDLYLLGIACQGMKDRLSDELLEKCKACTHRDPVIYDELFSDEASKAEEVAGEETAREEAANEVAKPDRFKDIEAIEALPRAERLAYFNDLYNNCIRCYACREVCPVCTCRECFVDQQRAGWQGKQNNLEKNRFYNLTRVFHIGDRCIECGECERVCPMGLPLMQINRKWIKDITALFAAGEEGLTEEPNNVLGCYDVNDIEEFM